MIINLNKNNLYSILLKGRKEPICGILLYEGLEWLFLRYIPVDYVLDGYILIRKRHIKNIVRGEEERFSESVIHLKSTKEEFDKTDLTLDEITDVLYYMMQHEVVIQFDFYDDSVCYIGRVVRMNAKTVRIQNIDTKGEWIEETSYVVDRIRTIQFDNDYINSLVAYNKWMENHNHLSTFK
jgi:hypothetical protein